MNSTETNSENKRWRAVIDRDPKADGKFFYSVGTTGVYCRPSCAARRPRRENVEYHPTTQAAENAGFRPCKRCKPNEPSRGDAAIARACELILAADVAPDLNTLAKSVGLSPSHFHRLFKSTLGTTPKAYALEHRNHRLRETLSCSGKITSAIYKSGFNSSGRFYATSKKSLGMKPSTFRRGGEGETIRFAFGKCSLGGVLVAASNIGICAITFGDDKEILRRDLARRFPNATLIGGDKHFYARIAKVIAFVNEPTRGLSLPLDIRGTAFQQRVWKALQEIPLGSTRSYSQIAKQIGNVKSTRAVARACGANSLAVAIPCHRVVGSNGSLTGYHWGTDRKAKLLRSETPAPGSADAEKYP